MFHSSTYLNKKAIIANVKHNFTTNTHRVIYTSDSQPFVHFSLLHSVARVLLHLRIFCKYTKTKNPIAANEIVERIGIESSWNKWP